MSRLFVSLVCLSSLVVLLPILVVGDPFVGQMMWVPYNFAPTGWAFCDGQLMPISQNTALFSLLGTQYGGDGTSNFALPNMQGNAFIGQGRGNGLSLYNMGETAGVDSVQLTIPEIPTHTHTISAAPVHGTTNIPSSGAHLSGGNDHFYASAETSTVTLNPASVSNAGATDLHNNMPPYLSLNCIISLQGVFPARS